MDSLRDPRNLGCELGVGEPETQERARGPTHTRHFLERIEIPAPRLTRSNISWYTSSKGMPRHAHGRRALINMGALI